MKAYIELTQFFLNAFGVVQLRGNESKSNLFFNIVVIGSSAALLVQMFLSLLFNQGMLDEKTLGLVMFVFWFQALVKLISLISNRNKLRETFQYLDRMMLNLNAQQESKSKIFIRRMYKVNLAMIRYNVVTVALFLTKPVFGSIQNYSKTGEYLTITPYSFWYPFEKSSWAYYIVYLYEVYAGVLITSFPFATDQLYLILVTLTATQFKAFGTNLLQSIETRLANDVVKVEIKNFVETHYKLIEICNFFNRMYSIPVFIHILTATLIICLVEFMVVVSDAVKTRNESLIDEIFSLVQFQSQPLYIAIPMVFALFNAMSFVFYLFWFGDKLRVDVIFHLKFLPIPFNNVSRFAEYIL